jgi:hypothetical protein
MTHSLSRATEALLSPARFVSVQAILEGPTILPRSPGIYGWWFKALPLVPTEGTLARAGRRLLYIGISPSRKSTQAGSRTIRDRLLNHCRGPIVCSTLRRTLACLLAAELALCVSRLPSGKMCLQKSDEERLTEWMTRHARVAWTCHDKPWVLEEQLLAAGAPRMPLNIRGSADPFRKILRRLRSPAGK